MDVFEHLMYLVSADEMKSRISPRIRFMIRDVLDDIMPRSILSQADSNKVSDCRYSIK